MSALVELMDLIEEPDLDKRKERYKKWSKDWVMIGEQTMDVDKLVLAHLDPTNRKIYLLNIANGLRTNLLRGLQAFPNAIELRVVPTADGLNYRGALTVLSGERMEGDAPPTEEPKVVL